MKRGSEDSSRDRFFTKTGLFSLARDTGDLAEEAGISKRTVERLEMGAVATQLSVLIRVCRVLDLLDRFELLIPEPVPSPIQQLKLRRRQRQRASRIKTSKSRSGKWHWADKS